MRWGLIALGLGAACGRDRGLEIVVDSPANMTIDRVSLFVADGDPIAPSPTLYPDGYFKNGVLAPTGVSGMIWALDQTETVDTVTFDDKHPPPATFLYPAPGGDTIPFAIAVGFSGTTAVAVAETSTPLEIPSSFVERYEMTLEPAGDPLATDGPAARVQVWWPPKDSADPGATCVQAQLRGTQAIVDPDDPDCDGYRADDPQMRECRADVYLGARGPVLTDTNCLADQSVNGTAMSVLGGPSCTDGIGQMPGCNPSAYCVPQSVKTYCHNFPDPMQQYTCAANFENAQQPGLPPPAPPTAVACKFFALVDSGTGRYTQCTDSVTVNPTGSNWMLQAWGVTGCDSIHVRDDIMPWSDRLEYPEARFRIGSLQSTDCTFTVSLDNVNLVTPDPANPAQYLKTGLLAFSRPAGHGFAIPIEVGIEPTTQCGTAPPYCYLLPNNMGVNDEVPACMQNTLPPGTSAN